MDSSPQQKLGSDMDSEELGREGALYEMQL